MKKQKMMLDGKWQKINGKFIVSIGYFAYDGCHKIYVLEKRKDVEKAMYYGYSIIPIKRIREYYDTSCCLKFITNWDLNKNYVWQGDEAVWSSVKATKQEIEKIAKKM